MGIVPSKLHFISPIHRFGTGELGNIIMWAKTQPHYTVQVWVHGTLIDVIARELAEKLTESPSSSHIRLHRDGSHIDVLWDRNGEPHTISVYRFEQVPPLTNAKMLHSLLTQFEKRHATRDMASLWVLYAHGGIFIDTDTQPGRGTLPENINAPRDILFAKFHRSIPSLVNNVVASPPRSNTVKAVHAMFESSYAHYFTQSFDLHPSVNLAFNQLAAGRIRYEEIQKAEAEGRITNTQRKEAHKVITAAQAANNKLNTRTEHNTEVIKEWVELDMLLHTPAPQPQPELDMGVPPPHVTSKDDDGFVVLDIEERFVEMAPYTPDPESLIDPLEYMFQQQTHYHPVIPPSALGRTRNHGLNTGDTAEERRARKKMGGRFPKYKPPPSPFRFFN